MAITLTVRAAADAGSFDRAADKAEKRFEQAGGEAGKAFAKQLDSALSKADPKAIEKWERAYGKAADAIGKVKVEQQKLNDLQDKGASNGRLVAQVERLESARRRETAATRDAGRAYRDLDSQGQGLMATLSNLASGTRFGGMVGDAEALAGRFGGVGLAVGGATIAVAGLALGIGAAGNKLYELGAAWDSVADGITARTGKVGDELQAVMDQVTRIAMQGSTSSIGELGNISAQVSASIGSAGDDLGDLTAYIADLDKMTGQQTNIKQLGMLYRVLKVDTADYIPVLNQLYTSFTKTQTPVNELIGQLVTAGPVFGEFGLSAGQSASLLASFNEAGLSGDKAIRGLRVAMTSLVKAGQDPTQALTSVIEKIRELSAAGEEKDAKDLALNVFGSKSYAEFLNAIESGKLSTRQLSDSLQGNVKDIRDVNAATNDAAEEFDILTNKLGTRLRPVSNRVFGVINDTLSSIIEQIDAINNKDFGAWFRGFNRPIGGPWSGGDTPALTSTPMTPDDVKGILAADGAGVLGPRSPLDVLAPGLTGSPGTAVRGTPGRGFPMPWTLPALSGGYGLPQGTDTGGYGSGSAKIFPPWVMQLADAFGVKPSTYSGHQESDRREAGYAPNPGGENRGIDWSGPVANMQRFADYLSTIPGALEQVIWQNPNSGARVGISGGRDVSGTQYYGADYGGHQDHVHTRQSAPIPLPGNTRTVMSSAQSAGIGAYGPGATPGYDEQGNPGYYTQDPKGIRSATERVSDVQESIKRADQRIADIKASLVDANQAILDAQQDQVAAAEKAAEVQDNTLATDEQKRSAARQVQSANGAVKRAQEQRDRIANRDIPDAQAARDRLVNRDLRDANEGLADAKQGRFQGASKRVGGGLGMQLGAPIASDFGLSGGLPGLAENLTNFAANMAMAPLLGTLAGTSMMADPMGTTQGGGGLIGMAASQAQIGGGGMLGNIFGGPTGAAPGPTTVGGQAPSVGAGGGGFGGLGGMPMAGLQAATASLDMLAPGASIAANIGIQQINRAAAQVGKYAGIGVGGLLETFGLGDSGSGWFGRIAAGVGGAKPQIPNVAGQSAPMPGNGQPPAGGGGKAGPQVNVTYNNNQATEDRAGADLTNHLTSMNSGPGW